MIVTALVLGPIVVGLALYAVPRERIALVRIIAAAVAALAFVLTLYDSPAADASVRWLSRPFTASFHLGFGPISFWIVLLLALVTFGSALALNGPRARNVAVQLLVLQGAMNGLFLSKDMLLFALFWDLMLLRCSWCCSTADRTRAPPGSI